MVSTLLYVGIIILVFTLICIAIYYYYIAPRNTNMYKYAIPLLTDETLFNETYTQTLITETLVSPRSTLYVPQIGYGLTFVWEMYIPSQGGNDKWQHNFNTLKPIITFGDTIISYHPKKNYLSISVKYRNNPFYAQFAEVKFTEMKLQCWLKYIILIENRNVRLFIGGTLVSTKTLPSVVSIDDIKTNINLGQENNNFLGKIRNLSLYPYPLAYDEIILA